MNNDKTLLNQEKNDSIRIECPRCKKPHAMECWTETSDSFIWSCDFCGFEYHEPRIDFVLE